MKELSLHDIKRISLELLVDLHDFCVKTDIKYSLGYGTLIGAIRHDGFIPWDDDIDIMMPRPDYDRFCKEYKSSKNYRIYAPVLNNSYISYCRICECEKTRVISPAPWNEEKTGVWIDIFPIDGADDNYDIHVNHFNQAMEIYDKQISIRFAEKNDTNIFNRAKNIIKRIIYGRAIPYAKKYEQFCKMIPFGSTSHLTNISCPNARKVIYYNLSDFKEFKLHKFEDREFYIVQGYDNILKSQYGDYLKLPPLECQIPCHGDHKYLSI